VTFVVLDTDVASRSFTGRLTSTASARLAGYTLCISVVTLGELTTWTRVRSWGPRRRAALDVWCRQTLLLDVDEGVAITWGESQARAQTRGRPRPVNDSWIAATCTSLAVPLATFNRKDYLEHAEHDALVLFDLG